MTNLPITRLGMVAVSRDCFPASLSRSRQYNRPAGLPYDGENPFY